MSYYRRALCALTGLGVVAASAVAVAPAAGAQPAAKSKSKGPVVVVHGLNNPRQLSLVGGKLYIAEAGSGGTVKLGSGDEAGYIGATGSISEVSYPWAKHGTKPHRVVTGLLSGAGSPDGSFATGADGVSVSRSGTIYIQVTSGPPELPASLPGDQSGRLLVTRAHHKIYKVANISKFEAKHDPDKHGVDTNPYAALIVRGGVLVADAAGNDVLKVSWSGHVSVWHVFKNYTSGACAKQEDPPGFPGCNYVPTSLATDKWGHVYVGGLGSEVPGQGRVTELSANGKHVLHTWKGFTSVTGVAIGPDGALYVSELEGVEAHPVNPMVVGLVTKVARSGHRKSVDVPFPAGIAVDHWGNVYVSAFSVATADGFGIPGLDTSGQVWRLRV